MTVHFPIQNSYPSFTVGIDFDGYLAPSGLEGEPNGRLAALITQTHAREGWEWVITTARPACWAPRIARWCARHQLPVLHVAAGAKPACDVFLDDRSPTLPPAALAEWLWRRYDTREGRAPAAEWCAGRGESNWRIEMRTPSEGGEELDDRFLVVVPFSGGLDSTTAAAMALRVGLPVAAVYVATGAAYTTAELARAERLAEQLQVPFTVERIPTDYQRIGFVDVGRNALIVQHLAEWAARGGWWGEVWLGNLDTFGETPVVGGDKSHRWMTTTQQLLTGEGYDVRLVQPHVGKTKTDLVNWWQLQGQLGIAADTFSCFSPTDGDQCGRCRACLRRYVAFAAAGAADWLSWPHGLDLAAAAQEAVQERLAAPPGTVLHAAGRLDQGEAELVGRLAAGTEEQCS